jgi:hypothetical protein
VVTWDSDASSNYDDDSDDDKTTKKKALASIIIQEKPSLFDTPSCFMAKAIKVLTCDDECDEEHDNESKSESDNDDKPTKDELIDMLEDIKEHFDIKRREGKDLRKELKALKQTFDELSASHERLEKAQEKLGKAYKKLKKAHYSLLSEQNKKEHAVTCDKCLTCDIIDESFYNPIIVASTNPSCSTSTSTSSNSDGFTCDASLMVENETPKKEVKKPNHTLAKAYDGKDRLLMCLGSQRAYLYKEGLYYIPMKGKATFANHKTSFVMNNGRYYKSCKQVGHIEQLCLNKKSQANVSSIKLDSFYVLTKGINGVHAKFIDAPWMGSKKKAIWVLKSLITNFQGPKQVWVPKKN